MGRSAAGRLTAETTLAGPSACCVRGGKFNAEARECYGLFGPRPKIQAVRAADRR